MMPYHIRSYFTLLTGDPEIEVAANTEISLYFDEHKVDFTLTERSLYFSCELLRMEEKHLNETAGRPANVLMAILLEANCMGSGAGGAIFLLDETNALHLKGQVLLAGIATEELSALLEDFLDHVDYWRPVLSDFVAGARGTNSKR